MRLSTKMGDAKDKTGARRATVQDCEPSLFIRRAAGKRMVHDARRKAIAKSAKIKVNGQYGVTNRYRKGEKMTNVETMMAPTEQNEHANHKPNDDRWNGGGISNTNTIEIRK